MFRDYKGGFSMNINMFRKICGIVLVVLFAITSMPQKISAETIGNADNATTYANPKYFDFNLNTYDTSRSNIPSTYTQSDTPYSAFYPDSFTYFDGSKYSVKIDVKYTGRNGYLQAGDTAANISAEDDCEPGVRLASDKAVELWALGSNYDVTFTFYKDNTFTETVNLYAGIEFEDPDQANYLFNATSKKLYRNNKTNKVTDYTNVTEDYTINYPAGTLNLVDHYDVSSSGLIHTMKDDGRYRSWPDFDNGSFAVLLDNESSFSYTIQGKQDYMKLLAKLMKIKVPYKVQYFYETEAGYPTTPDFESDLRYVDLYPTTPKVSVTDADKTPDITKSAAYALDTAMNTEWTKTVAGDCSTILKVYFNIPYTIHYNANATDATGEMADDVYSISRDTMPSKENWTFVRPGYEFIGFTYEDPNAEAINNGSVDYKDDLLPQDDREITLYAQWKPLDYKIVYHPNAEDATGEMPTDEYLGSDETMPSKETWTYVRPGYKFIGFTLEDETTINNGSVEYKPTLLPDEDRTINLYAQWEALPYTIKYNPNAEDATGTMNDDNYTGEDSTMPSKETWVYEREGYDFVGYKVENTGDTFNGANEYKPTLLADEDGVITLYAQWDPWKYTIKYDPNGGYGDMPDNVYHYPDEKMPSVENKFARDGYSFDGFVYTDTKGNKILYRNINDFKRDFMDLGKNSVILLVAQWKKNPETRYYVTPVTGVE